ncbi:MAG: PhzF family phenazine biosynthesis protein [Pelagimonas sp.]|jgi:trans-2,3-dihydro-3-hydroxyanthranilate isomerase|nr:PhzF family phenazine biosynthesis protein [Pelagimonas sp.]
MMQTGASLLEPQAAPRPAALPCFTCDVFTDQPYAGNPLAIVENADGLSTAQMQTMAREFNLSETIFVQTADDADHTAKVRIFFPTAEIPFAGHPTIGCAIHLALKSAPDGDFDTEITLEEVAGLVPVRVWRSSGQVRAEFKAPVIPQASKRGTAPAASCVAKALGLQPDQVGLPGHKTGLWLGGPGFAYAALRDLEALSQCTPQEPAMSQMLDPTGEHAIYVYTQIGENAFQARMFAPKDGIAEDPATGSASAIFAAQLLAAGVLSDGETEIALRQGYEMGRPSQIDLRITVKGGAIETIHVSGSAVPISSGHILPPTK